MVDEPTREIPAVVVVGVRRVPSNDQFETPSAVEATLRVPFVTLRFVPVMSVMTSEPILNEPVAAMFVDVAFVMFAFVPEIPVVDAYVKLAFVPEIPVDDA